MLLLYALRVERYYSLRYINGEYVRFSNELHKLVALTSEVYKYV